VEETPGHRANIVEELESGSCSVGIKGTCVDEEPEVSVDLVGGAVGDTPVVKSVSA